jgi:lipopolysaccharide export LptBFGC system permease protein LptF
MTSVARALGAFARFWRDFLIGDAPEVFVGVLVFVAAAFALHHHRDVAVVVLPLIIVALLGGSVFRGRAKT